MMGNDMGIFHGQFAAGFLKEICVDGVDGQMPGAAHCLQTKKEKVHSRQKRRDVYDTVSKVIEREILFLNYQEDTFSLLPFWLFSLFQRIFMVCL